MKTLESGQSNRLIKLLIFGVSVILLLLPFHALFTTYLGANFGSIDVFRIWKEVLLLLISLGVGALIWRDKELRQRLITNHLFKLIAAYIGLYIVIGAIALASGYVEADALLFSWITNLRFVVFFLLVFLIVSPKKLSEKNWSWLIIWPAVLVIIFGLLQQLILPADVLTSVGYGPDTIPAYQTVDQKPDYVRIQSTLRGANPLGAYLIVIISLLIVLMRRVKNRLFYGPILLAAAVVLFFTYSRSAMLGVIVALGVIVFAAVRQPRARRWIVICAALIALLGAGSLYLLRDNNFVQNTVFHTDETSRSATSSNYDRVGALENGAKDIAKAPLGSGPGTAGPASVRNGLGSPRLAENYFLQVGQEIGIIGLMLFLAINVLVARQLWRLRRSDLALALLASLAGITLVNLLSHAWTDDTLGLLWWGSAGAVIGAGGILGAKRPKDEKIKEKTA